MALRKPLLSLLAAVFALAAPASAAAAPPDIEIIGVQSAEPTIVEVIGRLNPSGSETQYRVQYDLASSQWCQSSGATGEPAHQTSAGTLSQTGNAYFVVSVDVEGLTAGTAYCARLSASNADGPDFGSIAHFSAGAPAVQAFSGEPTGSTTGRVRGSVNPVGRPTHYWVRYAPASSEWCQSGGDSGAPLDVTTPKPLAQTTNAAQSVIVDLGGLRPQTEYCAEIVASNDAGTGGSDHVSFTTHVQVCDATWDGGTGGWTDANWTFEAAGGDFNADGYPDPDDNVCIPTGTVTLTGMATISGLRVNGTGQLDVAGSLTVDDAAAPGLNDGTVAVESGAAIQLTSTGATDSSLAGGTLTNGGTIRTLAGGGGTRTITFPAIANGGGATFESNAATAIIALTFTNSGAVVANGGLATGQQLTLWAADHDFHQNAGTIGGSGAFVLENGEYHHNGGDVAESVLIASDEGLDLDGGGSAVVTAAMGTSYLTGDVAHDKTLNVVGGVAGLPATLSLGGEERTNAGTIVLTNAASGDDGYAVLDPGSNALTNSGVLRTRGVGEDAGYRAISDVGALHNTAGGTVDLQRTTEIASPVTNSGTFDVAAGATASLGGADFVQDGGTTTVDGELDLPAGRLDLQGGTLAGGGHVDGALDNSGGTVSPGADAPGELSVSGDYTQGEGGALRVDVDGTAAGSGHDRLAVGGAATLGGTLQVDGASFTPVGDEELTFVTSAGALGGTFATKTGMAVGGSRSLGTTYAAGPPGAAKLFVLVQHPLSVSRGGSGAGTVASSPAGIDCGSDCTRPFDEGSVVTLTATPADGSRVGGWSGAGTEACSGATCEVTVSAARSVTVTFVQQRALALAKDGSGEGAVTSNVAGIDCGADCAEDYDQGTVVTLTAAPAAGSRFGGWSGAGCSGTGTCQVTMSAAREVKATFVRQHGLAVAKAGSGAGGVAGSGIDCGSDCGEIYDEGTEVTLSATPAAGSRFAGWSGEGCSGTGTCQVTMSAARTVTATFTRQHTLTVAASGSGGGTISGAGIACGADCAETYDQDTAVTLTATPSAGSRFAAWSGAGTESCVGTKCKVTMAEARAVTVSFVRQRALSVTRTGVGAGSVSGTGITCGDDCHEILDEGASVTLTATPGAGSRFAGWSGDCSGTGTCQVTMSQARAVTATFAKAEAAPTPTTPTTPDPTPAPPVQPPANPQPPADADGDGVPDATDPDPADPAVPGAFGSTNTNDRLDAAAVGETICGLLGDDSINALGGDDTVFGDLCDVRAKLAAAQAAAGGNDTLSGGTGNDALYGAGGADKLLGDDGNDRLYGGAGNDSLAGGKGKDALDGGAGNDKLAGGADTNTYKGGAGDDAVDARNGKRETVDCGAGRKDSASVDKADRVKGCEKVKRAKR